jgi:tetratricopeptide (TPR) repeat protein
VDGLDVRSLPIGPLEALVLSRVDGTRTREEIATSVGCSFEAVARILERLAELGAVRFEGSASAERVERRVPAPSARSGAYRLELGPESAPPDSAKADEIELRRHALARKLGHSSLPPARSSLAPQSSRAGEPPPGSADEGRHRVRNQQLEHYIGLADAAAEKRDLVSACNFLRLACSLAPRDVALADRLKALELRAAAELWETYAERGRREALLGEWALAARSYERAALGHTSGELLERAAFCLMQAKGDLKRAGDFAKRAVAVAPQSIRCSLTLLRYYADANLRTEALAELERARMLAPEAPEVRDWVRRAKAGEL